ncbi:hypothetical protein SSPIM334S_08209 [Streptomyces spiroverticillatus]
MCRLVAGFLAGLVFWSLAPVCLGWHTGAVVSGSMEPAIRRGDVVVSAPLAPELVAPGAVLAFTGPQGATVVHRVVGRPSPGTFTTKGDANPTADSAPVAASDVIGLGRLRVPLVGHPVAWAATGQWVPLAASGVLLVLVCAGAVAPGRRDEDGGGRGALVRGGSLAGALAVLVVLTARPPAGASFVARTQSTATWTTAATGPGGCAVRYALANRWGDDPGGPGLRYFTVDLRIANLGGQDIRGWTLALRYGDEGPVFTGAPEVWGAEIVVSPHAVSLSNAEWDPLIPAHGSVGGNVDGSNRVGFNATYRGWAAAPQSATLNGVPCDVTSTGTESPRPVPTATPSPTQTPSPTAPAPEPSWPPPPEPSRTPEPEPSAPPDPSPAPVLGQPVPAV